MKIRARGTVFFFFFFFLLLLHFLGVVTLGQRPPPPPGRLISVEDLAGLYSLRSSLGLRKRDWPRKTDPCFNWTGVHCSAGRVVGLDLTGLRRTRLGRLSPAFAVDGLRNLTKLESFNSTGFDLPGPIPEWFGSGLAGSVAVLDLRGSRISGSVPFSIGSLVGLVQLSLSGNFLTGSVPPSIGGLGNLSVLDLSRNGLTGEVPGSIGNLLNLTVLSLSSNFLSGSIPSALGSLTKLERLVLANNSFSGSVPGVVGDLSSLVRLDFSMNSLSGPLSDDLRNMRSLRVMDLSNNSFTGELSERLFLGLVQLRLLTLSNNNFSDLLPSSLWALPELKFMDVSYNNFSGNFPEGAVDTNASDAVFNISHNFYYGNLPSGSRGLLQRLRFLDISGNYFEGELPFESANASVDDNCFRNASNQRSMAECTKFYADRGMTHEGATFPNQTMPSGNSSGKSNRRLIYILVGVFGGLILLVLLVLVPVMCLKICGGHRSRQREITPSTIPSGGANIPEPSPRPPINFSAVGDSFTYDQLLKATSDFSDENVIKHGHSGDLYHGVFESGTLVVVKRVDVRTIKREQYLVELDFFARASHTRLVPLLGHCLENEIEKLLVYKYMPHQDLSTSFYKKSGQEGEGLQSLDWITRSKIAIGVAEGLCYLHHECVPPLVHRDIQASSILLDDKFEVRLGSLSEVCTQEGDARQNVVTRFLRLSHSAEASTSGSTPATCAYDVYCFGKVLLELVTGKLGVSGSNEDTTNEWLEQTMPYINIYEKELLTKILDPSLVVDEDLLEEVWAMAIVAKSCLNSKPTRRPPVKYILKALENPLKVVREETGSNSARLRATSSRGSWNAALFGSWRSSSDVASASAPPREMSTLRHSDTIGSQGSGGEHSFNRRKLSKDIFPEPSNHSHDTED